MSFVDHPVTVRTPASSANLGPGYDALGLALNLYDELRVEARDVPGLHIEVTGEGAGAVPLDDSHLVVRSMNATFDLLGVRPEGLRLACTNSIPHGRGLGSSSAAIVGGIAAARALVADRGTLLDDDVAYQLAVDIEGHPDNVAAAMFGGLTIAWLDLGKAHVQRLDSSTAVTVFVPPTPVSTEAARGLIPDMIPHADAAANAGRAALLIAALTGAPEQLLFATEDHLHQSYRSGAMPESYALLRQLRVEGVPAIISGAGPTVLCFARDVADRAPQGWAVHELDVDTDGVTASA